jgi:hypothetical protein
MMNILCRLGFHFQTRQRLDLKDLELKTRCRLCGAAVGDSKRGADAEGIASGTLARRPGDRAALSLLTILGFALVLGSAAVIAHQGTPRTGASITVKLPPARPPAAGPGFSFDQ